MSSVDSADNFSDAGSFYSAAEAISDNGSQRGSDSDRNSDSDTQSQTSTVEYSHETFSTFQSKVMALAQSKIWPGADASQIVIEHINGGGYNRVIGISRLPQNPWDEESKYILRTPRFERVDLDRDVAAFEFVSRYTKIPCPKVIAFDETSDNEIEGPHMIQTRLDGLDAIFNFPSLTHEQKCKFAVQLGKVFREMANARNPSCAQLVLPSSNRSLESLLRVAPLIMGNPFETVEPRRDFAQPYGASNPSFEMIHGAFKRILDEKIQEEQDQAWKGWPYTDFLQMANEMAADGYLGGGFSLAHLDLEVRNILLNPFSKGDEPVLTGILDWDSAVFAPTFMSCKPPMWLWAWSNDDEEDERLANDEPESAENREIKKLFEEAAGDAYARYAYSPVYRLGRRLFRFTVEGLYHQHILPEAFAMLNEWKELYSGSSQVLLPDNVPFSPEDFLADADGENNDEAGEHQLGDTESS